jgi:hypothetical protein
VGDFGSNWEAGWPSRKPKLTNNQMRRKYSRSAIRGKGFRGNDLTGLSCQLIIISLSF